MGWWKRGNANARMNPFLSFLFSIQVHFHPTNEGNDSCNWRNWIGGTWSPARSGENEGRRKAGERELGLPELQGL